MPSGSRIMEKIMVQVYEKEAMGYAPVLKSKLIFKGIVAKEHVFFADFGRVRIFSNPDLELIKIIL